MRHLEFLLPVFVFGPLWLLALGITGYYGLHRPSPLDWRRLIWGFGWSTPSSRYLWKLLWPLEMGALLSIGVLANPELPWVVRVAVLSIVAGVSWFALRKAARRPLRQRPAKAPEASELDVEFAARFHKLEDGILSEAQPYPSAGERPNTRKRSHRHR